MICHFSRQDKCVLVDVSCNGDEGKLNCPFWAIQGALEQMNITLLKIGGKRYEVRNTK
jgi:hypothetical protein